MLGRPLPGAGTEVTFNHLKLALNFRFRDLVRWAGFMSEDLRKLVRWLAALHAPLGHWAPIAASVLFAGAGMSHSFFLRFLAYSGASIFIILIGADILRSFIDQHSFPDPRTHHCAVLTLPMLIARVILAVGLGSVYTFLVFIGVGAWTPFIFLPAIFLVCCFVAWRNVSLWYEQGEEFEQALAEAQDHEEHRHSSATHSGRAMPTP